MKNVTINNIKDLDVKIPLKILYQSQVFQEVVNHHFILQTLLPVAKNFLNNARKVKKVDGVEIRWT